MLKMANTIVLIEDERAIADTLIHVLELDGFGVKWFDTAGAGLEYLRNQDASLVVLDVGLPDANGFEVCKEIRAFSSVPVIFLTARNDEIDRVVGLEIGADDYVTKPFSPREMLARVKLRMRTLPSNKQLITEKNNANSVLMSENYDFLYQGNALGLTALEFKLLKKMVASPRQVFSRAQLMDAADLSQECAYERNIDTHIKAIRKKLRDVGSAELLFTKRGFGYYYDTQSLVS